MAEYSAVDMHLDTCYAGKFAENFQEIADQSELRPVRIRILAWVLADRKLEWKQVSPLFRTYSFENGAFFEDQTKEWKQAFEDHVNQFGFVYARFYREK